MAGLELVGDVLTFGPETEGTGEVSAMITSTKLVLESGDMIGALPVFLPLPVSFLPVQPLPPMIGSPALLI